MTDEELIDPARQLAFLAAAAEYEARAEEAARVNADAATVKADKARRQLDDATVAKKIADKELAEVTRRRKSAYADAKKAGATPVAPEEVVAAEAETAHVRGRVE